MPRFLKRWFNNMFSSKKQDSTQKKTAATENKTMSERKTPAFRKQRKLPSIPPNCRQQHTYWPSYRVALEYMQKHKDVVETALGLVELYPRLIQHSSCDRIWEFVSKVTFFDKLERKLPNQPAFANEQVQNGKKHTQPKNKLKTQNIYHNKNVSDSQQDKEHFNNTIPNISISHADEEDVLNVSIRKEPLPKVYICGHCREDRWNKLIFDMTDKYFIRCSSFETDRTTCHQDIDLFIFLLDEYSNNPVSVYAKELKSALAHGLHVLYIRDSSVDLPEAFPSNSCGDISHIQSTDGNISPRSGPGARLSAFTMPKDDYRFVSTGNIHSHFQTPSSYLTDKRNYPPEGILSLPGTPLLRSPSPYPIDQRNVNSECRRRFLDTGTRSYSAASNESTASYVTSCSEFTLNPKTPLPQLDRFHGDRLQHPVNVDVVRVLQQNVHSSILYDNNRHFDSMKDVLSAIDARITSRADSPNLPVHFYQPKTFLQTPASDMFSSKDSAIGDMYITTDSHEQIHEEPPRADTPSPDDNNSPSPETVFVVYGDDNSADRFTPKVVHFQNDRPCVDLSNSSSIESFGFQDIDLSRYVNELDLFSRSCESDFE